MTKQANWGLARAAALVSAGTMAAAMIPLASALPASAASATARRVTSHYGFAADAFGTAATVTAKGATTNTGQSALVVLGCTTSALTRSNSTAGVNIAALKTTTGNVTTRLSTHLGRSSATDNASSIVNGLSALSGLVQATAVKAYATATQRGNASSSAGSVMLVGMKIAGRPAAGSPAPNTTVNLPGVGHVTLNGQRKVTSGGRAVMDLTAVKIVVNRGNTRSLPAGTVSIGHARAVVGGPVSGLLSGRAFGTMLEGNPLVKSGPTYAAYENCTGTGGKVVTNTGAGVQAGPVRTGTVTDTASGIDTATRITAHTTSRVAGADVSGVLSASVISSSATASMRRGRQERSATVRITGLTVLGRHVRLPARVHPNYRIRLRGGTLILNRQMPARHGITVQAVYLRLPRIGTLVIASSSAFD